jgi:hypothetical protein
MSQCLIVGLDYFLLAYALDPSNPCSSPAKATSSTLLWNRIALFDIARAMDNIETVPEPSSSPPGALTMPNEPRLS